MSNFMESPKSFFTSESVTEGHPDKLCDQISDAILDAIIAQDPLARVACETATTTGLVLVAGEISTSAWVDMPALVRKTIEQIGYINADYGFDYRTCGVVTSIGKQSPDIDMGVSASLEARDVQLHLSDDELERVGAGDQGMMIGFACNETPEYMPMPISLAHKLTRQLSQVRRKSWGGNGPMTYLRPDGKAQVTIQYEHGKPVRVDTIVVSTQHAEYVDREQIQQDVIDHIIKPVIPEHLLDSKTKIFVNPTGRFVLGGPMGDAGLTGRKIIVDTYGGMARHGGGAFSGKDPTKVDRSAAYAARHIAKNIVAAGLADRLELQVSYAIGVARPLSLFVETFGTGKVSDEEIIRLINEHFDLRPAGIIQDLRLRRPIYQPTAAFGHFGRTDIDAPWEELNKVPMLRKGVGANIESDKAFS
ncbi:S-adenosylmethionine synthase [Ktedonobacter sp. SOSP1-85]|uniref:S-adenosylmethionine synthase n=2 Tax=Ktedonobacteraceae TaxID=388449 RepID=A0ABQ3UR10_9CHLR|nr:MULTISPECIES: methionine adenosyltransferase [Ktedonobacter]GHO54807.1 S-adenosylmethionine synthase [Ktedonobacter robiniae]GHO73558.1 S-adenosylmethionine synthase [Ktedonobacter sp. SOSP1-85]